MSETPNDTTAGDAGAEGRPALAGSTAYREATREDPTEHDERCFPGVQWGRDSNGTCILAATGITCPAESCDLHDGVRDEAGCIII